MFWTIGFFIAMVLFIMALLVLYVASDMIEREQNQKKYWMNLYLEMSKKQDKFYSDKDYTTYSNPLYSDLETIYSGSSKSPGLYETLKSINELRLKNGLPSIDSNPAYSDIKNRIK